MFLFLQVGLIQFVDFYNIVPGSGTHLKMPDPLCRCTWFPKHNPIFGIGNSFWGKYPVLVWVKFAGRYGGLWVVKA